MNSIVKDNLISFKELEQKIFNYVCEIERDYPVHAGTV